MDENRYPYRPPYQNVPPPYPNQQYGPQCPQNIYPFLAPTFQDVRPNYNYNIPPQNVPNYSDFNNYSQSNNNLYPSSIPYQNPSQSSVYDYYGNYYNPQNTVHSTAPSNPPNSTPYQNIKSPEKDFSQALDEYKKDRRTLEQKKETSDSADRFKKSYERYSESKSRSYDRSRRSSRRSRTRSPSRMSSRSSQSRRSRSSSRHQSKRRSRSMSRVSINSKLDQRNKIQINTRSALEVKINTSRENKQLSERESLLAQYRKDYCATSEEMSNKLEELSKFTQEETIEREKLIWFRTTPADLYYARDDNNSKIIQGTFKLQEVCDKFNEELVLRSQKVNANKPKYEPPQRKKKTRLCKHKCTKTCK